MSGGDGVPQALAGQHGKKAFSRTVGTGPV